MTTRSPRGRIGSTIRDKYRVDTFLATGSMANVYAATHRNGGKVALKILHRELASDPQMRERFKREGYFCNAIDHPGIAKAIDDDITDDDCPYIVMDLLEGENLEVRRKRLGGRLPLNEVLNVADKVLEILAVAHDKGILHRDLKPENIFITHEGAVKLLDFGVARFNDGKQSSDVTGVGMVLGTPAFMPPEQALGLREEVDARSDLWALGATLFTLLTGESVHTGDTAKAKLVATATKPARRLREVLPNLPSAATSVLDRALEYHRSERWDDAVAMREALRWARMSLDPEAEVMTSSSPMMAAANAIDTTRRVKAFTDDEPTVMRKGISEEDVFTSAPPVTARATMPTLPDDQGPTLSESGESSIAFSLRNDPVFSLRQQKEKKPSERPPNTQRLPNATPDNDLGLPPLVPESVPLSEDVRMEYTRPMMAIPKGLRGTMPLPNTPGSGSGSIPAVNPNHVPAPPPSNPQITAPPPSNPQPNLQTPSQSLPAPVPSAAPPSSGTGTKIFLALLLVAMLGGTVVILMMRKGAIEARTLSTTTAAPPPASVSAPPTESASAATTAEPSPTASASASPSASAEATPIPSASASSEPIASASASASASAAPVVAAKPRPRPRPQATATATASAASTETTTAAPTTTPVPVPIPSPEDPSPSP